VNVFCIRPRRFNVGNETINLAVRALLREEVEGPLNLVPIPATESEEEGSLSGLGSRTAHEINLYGHGVVVGGGNLYENGQLDVDLHALSCLRPPMLLLSLSHGRIYDDRRRLTRRTDAMPDRSIVALNHQSVASVTRDDATLRYLHDLGLRNALLGGCPTLLLADLLAPMPTPAPGEPSPVLLSVRDPRLMSIPLADKARVHADVRRIIDALRAEGLDPVHLLCHDKRDLAFAASFGDVEYVLPDDALSYLDLLRRAHLVVSFRLHAFVPCLSFGTHTVNISYDERSESLVRTLGLDEWDIDYLGEADVVAEVLDRARRKADLEGLVDEARPRWDGLERVTREAIGVFAEAARAYAAEARVRQHHTSR
jgi:hypothetical protein